jgi:hypothetical protein
MDAAMIDKPDIQPQILHRPQGTHDRVIDPLVQRLPFTVETSSSPYTTSRLRVSS